MCEWARLGTLPDIFSSRATCHNAWLYWCRYGQAAIVATIDDADKERPFDFFGVVEAQGDAATGNFSSWPANSAALRRLAHVSGKSE
jgi:hypothetical protein